MRWSCGRSTRCCLAAPSRASSPDASLRPRFEPGSIGDAGVRRRRRREGQRDDPSEAGAPTATIALTQADGRFTFFDPHFTSGNTQIRVDTGTGTFRATAFQVAGLDTKILTDDALSALIRRGHFSNIAFANITLPPEAPPPPAPQIRIRVFTETNGVRKDTDSLVIADTPLVIGFTAQDGTVRGATINGEEFSVHVDPLQGQVSANGMDAILDRLFTPSQPGSYTITATALAPFGPPVSATQDVPGHRGRRRDEHVRARPSGRAERHPARRTRPACRSACSRRSRSPSR